MIQIFSAASLRARWRKARYRGAIGVPSRRWPEDREPEAGRLALCIK